MNYRKIYKSINESLLAVYEGVWASPFEEKNWNGLKELMKEPFIKEDDNSYQKIYNLYGSDAMLDEIGFADVGVDLRPLVIECFYQEFVVYGDNDPDFQNAKEKVEELREIYNKNR